MRPILKSQPQEKTEEAMLLNIFLSFDSYKLRSTTQKRWHEIVQSTKPTKSYYLCGLNAVHLIKLLQSIYRKIVQMATIIHLT